MCGRLVLPRVRLRRISFFPQSLLPQLLLALRRTQNSRMPPRARPRIPLSARLLPPPPCLSRHMINAYYAGMVHFVSQQAHPPPATCPPARLLSLPLASKAYQYRTCIGIAVTAPGIMITSS